ncbi:MAG: hypothetical protein ACMUJJ_05360 [Roseicyclus sp.]|uniref:hypothetical protein n=1 Tax=Roseicyclus sp. TaxID=1914329 RepID=UPI003A8859AB
MNQESDVFTIIGGGFGIYGYLPALVTVFGRRVILPEKYNEVVRARPELSEYFSSIHWESTLDGAIAKATGVVLAVPPKEQVRQLGRLANFTNLKKIVVEKPIAVDPKSAFEIIRCFADRKLQVRVGYIFQYCDWLEGLKLQVSRSSAEIEINWTFTADHIFRDRDTWKRYHSLGGGVLRFYGIHLLAVLASLGYNSVEGSGLVFDCEDQPTVWKAQFAGRGLPALSVYVSLLGPSDSFSIVSKDPLGNRTVCCERLSPLPALNQQDTPDVRIDLLDKILRSFSDEDSTLQKWYQNTNLLWERVESASTV